MKIIYPFLAILSMAFLGFLSGPARAQDVPVTQGAPAMQSGSDTQGPSAAPNESAMEEADLYVVDAIAIEGDAAPIQYTLAHVIDLKPGTAFRRTDLDARLSDIRQRLFALDYFESIDFRLEKGTTRRHFNVVFTLKPYSDWYLGYRLLRGWDYEKLFNNDRRSLSDYLHAFGGTRDFLGTGLTLDMDYRNRYISRSDSDRASDRVVGESHTYSNEFTTTLISPQWLENRVFFGGSLALVTYENYYKKKDETDVETTGPLRSQNRTLTFGPTGILGIRLGLWTLTGGASRLGNHVKNLVEFRDDTTGETDETRSTTDSWYSEFSGEVRYSEKTYLAALEPGFTGSFSYTTDKFSHDKNTYSYQGKVLYSMMYDKTLLTPIARYQIDEDTTGTRYSQYDYSFADDIAIARDILIGFEYGFYRDLHYPIDDATRAPHRILGRIQYLTHHFNIEVAFMYGNPGLSEDKLSLTPLSGRGRL